MSSGARDRSDGPSDPIGETLAAFDQTTATLVGVVPAGEVSDAVGRRRYLHAGPSLALGDVPGPMRGAITGALVFEGEAESLEDAAELLDDGDLEVDTCNDAGAVGAMAGIVTPGMPVMLVESDTGSTAFSPLNEGLGRALRFGANGPEVLGRLRWLRDVVAPLLDRAVDHAGGVEITELQAEGLRRGDECHNRNVASTAALLARLAPHVIRSAPAREDAAAAMEWAASNPHFFLPVSMAAARVVATSAHDVPGSPIVTTICGNGIEMGVRVSGLGRRWLRAPAPLGEPRLFPNFTPADAQPMMGDSYIAETIGLGALSLSASPAITSFVGGDPRRVSEHVAEMRRICAGTSSRFLLPFEGFLGSPMGIDVHRVARTGIAPIANTGLAHRRPGVGQVGAGLTRLPLEPFVEASRLLGGP